MCDCRGSADRPIYRFAVGSGGRVLFRLRVQGVAARDELIALFKDRFPAPDFSVSVEQASWQTLGGW